MGAYCCGQERQILHLNILSQALKQSPNKELYSFLLTQDKKKQIKMLFYGNTPNQTQQKYDQIFVKAMPIIEPSGSNIELCTSQLKKKLIITSNQESSLRSQTNIENKSTIIIETGFIVYQNGYYYGDIVRNKEHGLGVYSLISAEVIIIRGQWHSGKFIKGNLFKRHINAQIGAQQKLFYLQLKNGIKSAIVQTPKFKYQGSIKLNIKTLNEMMTGEGTITYKDTNSTYTGKIKNGIFHTQDREESHFSINQEELKEVKYSGFYSEGFRQNHGKLAFDYEGMKYQLTLKYQKGEPIGEGKIKCGDSWTYVQPRAIPNQRLLGNYN